MRSGPPSPGEHTGGIFAGALVGEDASGKGERAGDIFKPSPREERGPVLGEREGDFGDAVVGEGLGVVLDADLAASDGVDVFVIAERFLEGGGFAQKGESFVGGLG